jgi:uncharacterized protein
LATNSGPHGFAGFVYRRPVLTFVAAAFLFSYPIGLPVQIALSSFGFKDSLAAFYVGRFPVVFGPAFGAFVVLAATSGFGSVKSWVSQRLKGHLFCQPVFWAIPALSFSITILALFLAGNDWAEVISALKRTGHLCFVHLVLQIGLIGLFEELGWRGWLLPKLLEARSPIRATLWVAVIWAVWHLPVLFSGLKMAVSFLAIVAAISFIQTSLYRISSGGVWLFACAHGSVNAPLSVFENALGFEKTLKAWPWLVLTYGLIALVLVVVQRRWFVQTAASSAQVR